MTIESDIAAVSHHVAGHSTTFPRLLQSINQAEGGDQAFVRAIHAGDPSVVSRAQALPEGARTIVHYMSDWIFADPVRAEAFVRDLATHWAPVGVDNDPANLNANWPDNVLKFLAASS